MSDRQQPQEGENEIGVLWGCEEIGAAIGRSKRQVHHLLEKGALPGARKVGGRWFITRRRLKEFFEGTLQ
jgi:hypothetical protein